MAADRTGRSRGTGLLRRRRRRQGRPRREELLRAARLPSGTGGDLFHWTDDTATEVDAYARAGIPVHLVADRKHDEVLLCTGPVDGKYPDVRYRRGRSVPVPESVGVPLGLSAGTLLDGDD